MRKGKKHKERVARQEARKAVEDAISLDSVDDSVVNMYLELLFTT